MATTETALALYTPPPVLSIFNETPKQLSKVDKMVLAVRSRVETLAKTSRSAFGSTGKEIESAEDKQKRLNETVEAGKSAIKRIQEGYKGIVSKVKDARKVMGKVGEVMDISDQMTNTRTQLSFMVNDKGSVKELEDKIMASAQRSRTSYMDTAAAVVEMNANAGSAFNGNDEVIGFMEQVNKQLALSDSSAEQQQNAMAQISQAMSAGSLRAEQVPALMAGGSGIGKSIESYMGLSAGELQAAAEQGTVTADVIKNAMFYAMETTDKKFADLPMTWEQVWTGMQNKALSVFEPILSKISEITSSPEFASVMDGLAGGMTALAQAAEWVFNAVVSIATYVIDNWGWIGPIIAGIVTIMLLYNAVALASNIIIGLQAMAAQSKSAADKIQAKATDKATSAQNKLNMALLSSPITWIILLIIALIVVFAIFTEQIVGAVWWLGALFKNILQWIANVAIGVWNSIQNIWLWIQNLWYAVVAIVQNIVNGIRNFFLGLVDAVKAIVGNIATAFGNAWIWIQIQFWTLVDGIMQGLKDIADLANNVLGWMGINIDTSGFDFAKDKINELKDSYGEFEDVGEAWNRGSQTYAYKSVGDAFNTNDIDWKKGWEDGYNTFDVFQDGWGSDAYNSGAEIGAGIHDSIMGIFDDSMFGDKSNSLNNESNPYKPTLQPNENNPALDDIAANTKDISNSLDYTEEDLSYMRDIAEREAINRFTTAEIRVDMTNNNNIGSDMDLDGVVNYLASGVSRAMERAAEGVHA